MAGMRHRLCRLLQSPARQDEPRLPLLVYRVCVCFRAASALDSSCWSSQLITRVSARRPRLRGRRYGCRPVARRLRCVSALHQPVAGCCSRRCGGAGAREGWPASAPLRAQSVARHKRYSASFHPRRGWSAVKFLRDLFTLLSRWSVRTFRARPKHRYTGSYGGQSVRRLRGGFD